MKQYYPEAEMCIEVTIGNINNETQEDTNMAAKNTTINTATAPVTPAASATDQREKDNSVNIPSVSINWKGVFNSAREHLANGYTKGKTWVKEHPKHTAVGFGLLTLAALLKLRSKKSNNEK